MSSATLSSYYESSSTVKTPSGFDDAARYALPANAGGVILLYFLLFCVVFIVLITFNPGFVQKPANPGSDPQPDFGKCFATSLVVALILCIIIWLFLMACPR
jgi:ABC-type Fe3+ transport system permease subunit